MRRRRNIKINNDFIEKSLIKINDSQDSTTYSEKYLIETFNSNDSTKIEQLMSQLLQNSDKENISLLIYKLDEINLDLFDVNFFKISDLELIMTNFKRFSIAKLFEIFNNFIINHESQLRTLLKIKILKLRGKIKLTSVPILYDYLVGMKIIKKTERQKIKDVNYVLANVKNTLINIDLNKDYNFINKTIQEIKNNKFNCTSGTMIKLIKFLNAPSKKIIITENQLCEIIRGLKKKYANNAGFITKLNYHGFIFAMDLMKEKFNIDCFSRYSYSVNKKIIDEDNGVIFEYLLKHNKINLQKMNEHFVYKILKENKNNIINVLIKYKCDLSIQITNLLLGKFTSYSRTKRGFSKIRDKSHVLEMIMLCEKIGYVINEEVFYHILKFFPDDKILEYIEKYDLIINDVIPIIVQNKLWSVLNKIFSDIKYKYSKDEYIKNIYILLSKIEKSIPISTYIEIYNYNITKYKIKPNNSLKKIAFNALDINLIKKLVEKYNFKYTLANVKKYMSRLNRNKNGWNYFNCQNKIYALVLIIDYLSNNFEEIKLIYKDNRFYTEIRKITRKINDKITLYLLKKNQIKVTKDILKDIIRHDSPDSLRYILENNNKIINISKKILTENDASSKNVIILLDYMNKNNIKISQDEILCGYLNGYFDTSCMTYLIDNKMFEINTQIITLLVLDVVCNYYNGDILMKSLYLFPKISKNTFEYVQTVIIRKKQEKYHKTKFNRYSRIDKLLKNLTHIAEMTKQLTIINEEVRPYKLLNIEIDENDLTETQKKFTHCAEYGDFKIDMLMDESDNENDDIINDTVNTTENINEIIDENISRDDSICSDNLKKYSDDDYSDNSDKENNGFDFIFDNARPEMKKKYKLTRLSKQKINIID